MFLVLANFPEEITDRPVDAACRYDHSDVLRCWQGLLHERHIDADVYLR